MPHHHCFSPFALEYAIRKVWAHQGGLKFKSQHQLLVYVADVNLKDKDMKIIKKEALLVASK
jgi:hypothetical protein